MDKKTKFIYSDSWGSIILRNEAWITIENLVAVIKMERFWERVIKELKNKVQGKI